MKFSRKLKIFQVQCGKDNFWHNQKVFKYTPGVIPDERFAGEMPNIGSFVTYQIQNRKIHPRGGQVPHSIPVPANAVFVLIEKIDPV